MLDWYNKSGIFSNLVMVLRKSISFKKQTLMKNTQFYPLSILIAFLLNSCGFTADIMTKEQLRQLTPSQALQRLIDGNDRFSKNNMKTYRLDDQRYQLGKKGAFPSAVVLCGPDSRVAPELIFNQSLGDIFCLRSPASIVTAENLGAMEHAAREIGSKVFVFLLQSKDPYIEAAIDENNTSNFSAINYHIRPAIRDPSWKKWKKPELIATVTREYLQLMMEKMRLGSPLLRGMYERGEITLVSGIYDVETGKVIFIKE
jgi:carbonic anhydrase